MAASLHHRLALVHFQFRHGVMSLPGLGLSEPEEVAQTETSHHDLNKDSEWRFEVAAGKYIQVKVRQPKPQFMITIY